MDCCLIIFDGFGQPPLVKTDGAHVDHGVVEIGPDFEGLLKMRRRVVVPTALSQSKPQAVFYCEVGRGDCESVLKQSEAVTPEMNLHVGKSSKNQQNNVRHCCTQPRRNASPFRHVRQSEHDCNEQTN